MLVVIGLFLATLIAIAFSTVHIKTRSRPAGYLEEFDDGGPCIDSMRAEIFDEVDECIKKEIIPALVRACIKDDPDPPKDKIHSWSLGRNILKKDEEFTNLVINRLNSGFVYGDFQSVSSEPSKNSNHQISVQFYLRKRVKRRQRGELTEVE